MLALFDVMLDDPTPGDTKSATVSCKLTLLRLCKYHFNMLA